MESLINPQLTISFRGWDRAYIGDSIQLEMWIDVNNVEHHTKVVLPATATQEERIEAFKRAKNELLQHFTDNLLTIHLEDSANDPRRSSSSAINPIFP